MKRTILLAATLLLALGTATAQDTVISPLPKAGYFYNTWVQPTGSYDVNRSLMAINGYVQGIFFHTPDTLPVYGIAAALVAMGTSPSDPWASSVTIMDTSMKEVYEYLGLYKYEGDTLRTASDSLLVHMSEPVSYYYHPDIGTPLFGDTFFSFYERYFDTPVMMTDTFLVGMTLRTSWQKIHTYYTQDTVYIRPVIWQGLVVGGFVDTNLMGIAKWYDSNYDSVVYQIISDNDRFPYRQSFAKRYPLIFPILTPQDTTGGDDPGTPIDTTVVNPIDTTGIDTTGVGIADVQLVGRYVSLQPNPAAERVLVTSSFGLQRVEIYNTAGARVRDEQASGYTATLTVGDLPEGAYLLRIHTPLGATTKKLVVKRQ